VGGIPWGADAGEAGSGPAGKVTGRETRQLVHANSGLRHRRIRRPHPRHGATPIQGRKISFLPTCRSSAGARQASITTRRGTHPNRRRPASDNQNSGRPPGITVVRGRLLQAWRHTNYRGAYPPAHARRILAGRRLAVCRVSRVPMLTVLRRRCRIFHPQAIVETELQ
jgi:hypothetical protein